MQPFNAFIGKTDQPTTKEIHTALGQSAPLWDRLIAWLTTEKNVQLQEWHSTSPNHGWALKLKTPKRTIVYLAPCGGCFQASFALSAKAIQVTLAEDLPLPILEIIRQAPRYAEGTGVRIIVSKPEDLHAIQLLAAIKLAN